jgi:hypothetical protein
VRGYEQQLHNRQTDGDAYVVRSGAIAEVNAACDRWLRRRGIATMSMSAMIKQECSADVKRKFAMLKKIRREDAATALSED